MSRLLTATALIADLTMPAAATTESCAIVRKTPDGFLNMRYQPKMGAVIVGRLKPGEHVLVHDETVPPQSRGKWACLAVEITNSPMCAHDTWTLGYVRRGTDEHPPHPRLR